jgi:hypothetical protein
LAQEQQQNNDTKPHSKANANKPSTQLKADGERSYDSSLGQNTLDSSQSFPAQFKAIAVSGNGGEKSRSARFAPIQRQENNTGLPDNLKSGMENLSGMSLDQVKVHYNSSKPAAVQAHAYAQGSNIHLGSGQEKHLPHELGHVVQQAQGRVKPTTSVNGMAVNDNLGLETEADVMGGKALQMQEKNTNLKTDTNFSSDSVQFKIENSVVQREIGNIGNKEENDKTPQQIWEETHTKVKKLTPEEQVAADTLSGEKSLKEANKGRREQELERLKKIGLENNDAEKRLKNQLNSVGDHNHVNPEEIDDASKDQKLLATLAARKAGANIDGGDSWVEDGPGKWKKIKVTDWDNVEAGKKKIPHWKDYLSQSTIESHLDKFKDGGHAFVPTYAHTRMMGSIFDKRFKGWGSGEIFLAPIDEGNYIHQEATNQGGISTLERKCGLDAKAWSKGSNKKMWRYFVPQFNVGNIGEYQAKYVIELATGQEYGAHPHFWNAGGMTTGGLSEGIIKAIDRKSLLMAISKNEIIQEEVTYEKTPEETLT